MKTNTFRSMIVMSAAGLLLAATPLWARDGQSSFQIVINSSARNDYGRHDYPRYDHGQNDLARAANRLERETERLHELAHARAHHGSRKEARAIGRLHDLANEADQFSDITRGRTNRVYLRTSYEDLIRAWNKAEASYRALHPTKDVTGQFRRTADAMRDLQAIIGNHC
jgi:hypothetical protein